MIIRKSWTSALAGVAITAALAGCGVVKAPGSSWNAPAVPKSSAQAGGGGGGQAAVPAAPPADSHPLVPVSALKEPKGKFFGVEANGAPDNMAPVATIGASVGVTPNLVGEYTAWGGAFDTTGATNVANSGDLYYMVWEPFTPSVADIASGASDAYIKKFAQSVRSFGKPMALSFGHEMNGNWYPWGTTGASATDFAAAWRHVHDLFEQANVTNVIWVWNPNVIIAQPNVQLEPYWPGSSYVDWVGVTGYFAVTGEHTFDGLYGPTLTEIRQFTSKPVLIAETSVETSDEELSSISSLISSVKDDSDVIGFIWFDYNKAGVDWTIEDRPNARAAMATALSGISLASLQP